MGLFDLFGGGKNTVKNPQILICVIGTVAESATYLEHDKMIYRAYSNITTYEASDLLDFRAFMNGKTFDVVHLFCTIEPDGTITGKPGTTLAQCLATSGVKSVLFASDNEFKRFTAAFPKNQQRDLNTMNVVFTIERKNENFQNFFQAIFDQMAKGKTMPMSWVNIAPQHDGPWMEKLPATMFLPNRGSLKLLA